MRTWLYEEAAVAVPLLRICQLTYREPPGATLPEPGVTFNGCTSTVPALVTVNDDETASSLATEV